MNMEKNENIRCTVDQCRFNMQSEPFCGLDCIRVGTHESDPSDPRCVDCNSFEKRSDGIA